MDKIYDRTKQLPNDRYITDTKYKKGLVAFIDILGFSNLSMQKDKFLIIRNMFNKILGNEINEEINYDDFRISIGSDSILITMDTIDDYSLNMLIDKVFQIRRIVLKEINLEIRAFITFGSFIHGGYKNQVFFGPSITMAVNNAENIGVFKYDSKEYAKTPAMICIDSSIFTQDKSPLYCYNYGIKITEHVFVEIVVCNDNKRYYVINPYYKEYLDRKKTKEKIYEENKILLKKQISICTKEEHKMKYYLYYSFLEDFIKNTYI